MVAHEGFSGIPYLAVYEGMDIVDKIAAVKTDENDKLWRMS